MYNLIISYVTLLHPVIIVEDMNEIFEVSTTMLLRFAYNQGS